MAAPQAPTVEDEPMVARPALPVADEPTDANDGGRLHGGSRQRARAAAAIAGEPEPAAAPPEAQHVPRLWWLYMGGGLVMTLTYFLVTSTLATHVMYEALGLSSVLAIIYGVRKYRPRSTLPWYLFALGQLLFVMGDSTRAFYESVLGFQEAPFPGLADCFYLGGYLPLAAGFVLLVRGRDPSRDRSTLIDALILAVGAGVVAWVYLMAPYTSLPGHPIHEMLIEIAYPLMDVLLLAVAVRLAVTPGDRPPAYYFLGASLFGLLIADCIYTVALLKETYHSGYWGDTGWLLSYILWGAAAMHPSMAKLSEPAPAPDLKITGRRLLLLAGASMLAPGVRLVETIRGHHVDVGATVVPTIVLFALVMLRMSGLVSALSSALSRHEEAERRRRASEERFGSLVQNSSDVVTVTDARGLIGYQSPSVHRVLGYRFDELTGKDILSYVHADDRAALLTVFTEMVEKGSALPARVEFRWGSRSGEWRTVETIVTNLLDDPTVSGIVLNTRDVTDRLALQEQLVHQAFHDPLTDLANRALLLERIEHALDRRARPYEPIAVLFLDVDDFKKINDSLGHSSGDQLLMELAERIRSCLRGGDTPARLGGDEFAILLEHTSDAEGVAARIADALKPPFVIEGREVCVTASIGICVSSMAHGAPDELLRNADTAMYTAKSRGKARYEIFQQDMHLTALRRLDIEAELRRAVERSDFRVHYQPIVDAQTGSIHGLEALVRWAHPERGLLGPGHFIPLAEETGLIVPIGRWVLQQACRQARLWQVKHPTERPLTMSVNVAAEQLCSNTLADEVADTLKKSGLSPAHLILEMTERAIMRDTEATVAKMRQLKALGVRLAVDDFGTGFSSLSYLQHFPIDSLKIAKPFIDDIPGGAQALSLVRGIVELGRNLELEVVAEGIERDEQWHALMDMRCEHLQGFLFARPQGGARIEQLLAAGRPLRSAPAANAALLVS